MLAAELKPHEKVFIARKRDGETQATFALKHGIEYTEYRRIEKGLVRASVWPPSLLLAQHRILATPRELAVITRKRSGLTQDELAEEMGITRGWLISMENGLGNSDSLVEYWKNVLTSQ